MRERRADGAMRAAALVKLMKNILYHHLPPVLQLSLYARALGPVTGMASTKQALSFV